MDGSFLGSSFVLLPLGLSLRGRPEKLSDTQQQIKLSRLLLDGLDSVEQSVQSAFYISTRQTSSW